MNASGNTTSVAPSAAAFATCDAAQLSDCDRSSTTGGCWTTATSNMIVLSGVKCAAAATACAQLVCCKRLVALICGRLRLRSGRSDGGAAGCRTGGPAAADTACAQLES